MSNIHPNDELQRVTVEPYLGPAAEPLPLPEHGTIEQAKVELDANMPVANPLAEPSSDSNEAILIVGAIIALLFGFISAYAGFSMPNYFTCPLFNNCVATWTQWLLFGLALPGFVIACIAAFNQRFRPRSGIITALVGLMLGLALLLNTICGAAFVASLINLMF